MTSIAELLKEHNLSDVEAVDRNGNTVLHLALKNEKLTQTEIVEVLELLLLNSGVDPDTKNRNKETVLQLAVKNKMKDVIDFLLIRKININSVVHFLIEDEYTKFCEFSSQNNNFDKLSSEIQNVETESASFIKWLISKGFDFDSKQEKNQSALLMAIDRNLQHILPVLLQYTKDINFVDETNRTLLHLFLEKADRKNLQRFGISRSWYSKRYATDIVRILLNRGISADAEDNYKRTPIEIAIDKEEDFEIIEMLLEHCTNAYCQSSHLESLFSMAIRNWVWSEHTENDDHQKVARALITKGADVNPVNDCNPLPCTIYKRQLRIAEFLRENGADFKCIESDGRTLMHSLAQKPWFVTITNEMENKFFDMLISNGCELNAKDKHGLTPLHIAADYGHKAIVEKLVEHGADVNCRNDRRETPLYYLVNESQCSCLIAELLLEHGANVNAKNIEGSTVLHKIATARGSIENLVLLECLLKYGADFSGRNAAGHSVLRIGLWQAYDENRFGSRLRILPDKLPNLKAWLDGNNHDTNKVSVMLNHCIKLDVANLNYDTDDDYRQLRDIYKYKSSYESCSREIEKLKSTFIDSRTTLYDFLHMSVNSKCAYANNEKLLQLIHSPEFNKQFLEYSVLVLASYHEAVARRTLLGSAREAWLELTKIDLPDICLDVIFSFLSNSDLFVMIEKD